jgi:hypothetical protein
MLFSPACAASIYMGEHDECVRELQTLLTKAGATMSVDADFGPETLRKVTAFQVLAGLTANGAVDDSTKRVLYAGTVRMTSWTPQQVERRIRQVFPEEPERALRIARCQSFLDPFYVLPNTNGTRNWGVFQLADFLLRRYGGTPRQAFNPEWNIQTARRVWAEHHGFGNWPHCDPNVTASPTAGPAGPGWRTTAGCLERAAGFNALFIHRTRPTWPLASTGTGGFPRRTAMNAVPGRDRSARGR